MHCQKIITQTKMFDKTFYLYIKEKYIGLSFKLFLILNKEKCMYWYIHKCGCKNQNFLKWNHYPVW